MENARNIFVAICSIFLAAFPYTANYVIALLVLFGFNAFCGMCADGISITNCKPFSIRKFRSSLIELFIYVMIVKVVNTVILLCENQSTALYAARIITLILCYVYLRNSFRNLVIAYPLNMAYRVIYYLVSLEFTKLMPANIAEIMRKVEEKQNKELEESGNTRKKE